MTSSTEARRIRHGIVGAILFLLALVSALVLPVPAVHATHEPSRMVKGTFPNHGFLWLDDLRGNGGVWVYSDRCKPAEASTWNRIHAQLAGGTPEFRGAWPYGIELAGVKCTATVDAFADIMLDYMTSTQWTSSGHGSYGGHHHYSMGDSNWCSAMGGARYPCGYHVSRLHINEPRFDGYTSTYKIYFLMHETGHSMGFYDYCGHSSVANNGALCSLKGAWYSGDKKVLRDVVYRNSPVY
jgi:hypothetical protein